MCLHFGFSIAHRVFASSVCSSSSLVSFLQKKYCELCHSSAERLYYHNYHAAYYSDYYSDYFMPYFTQALVDMEKDGKRTGKDNAYNTVAYKGAVDT